MLFSDLVGSTELSRRLDPEDLREVLRRYQDAVAAVVGKNVRLQSSDMLGTVGKGLGLCAQRVFAK